MKIYQVNDHDWFTAESPEQAMQLFRDHYGEDADELLDGFPGPVELSEETCNRLLFSIDESDLVCECGEKFNRQDKRWRPCARDWEHYHGPQAGYVKVPCKIPFADVLKRDPRPGFFATTEI